MRHADSMANPPHDNNHNNDDNNIRSSRQLHQAPVLLFGCRGARRSAARRRFCKEKSSSAAD